VSPHPALPESTPPSTLRLRVAQTAPVPGEVSANRAGLQRLASDAADEGIELLVSPELSLTGYDLRDQVHALTEPLDGAAWRGWPARPDVVVGGVEAGTDRIPYNVAVHLRGDEVIHCHRKVYLPTYGMFDEGRWFGRGSRVRAYAGPGGWRMGMLVCEDLWHPALPYLLAMDGADLVVVLAAGPGRGARSDGGQGFASTDRWDDLARTAAALHGIYVVLANRAGVEGGVVFAGASRVYAPDGGLIAAAPAGREAIVDAVLDPDAVAVARRPGAHLRDEDPWLVVRELERIARGR
jgi:predicted amidohydrolase